MFLLHAQAMLHEFKLDYNQKHFVRNETFKKAADSIQVRRPASAYICARMLSSLPAAAKLRPITAPCLRRADLKQGCTALQCAPVKHV